MSASPTTRPSLLLRIRDVQDDGAWTQFVEIYGPLVYGYARKRGLQDADAADLMQEVLRSVARSVGGLEYDPKRGTFRGWLLTITRNALHKYWAAQQRELQATGGTAMQALLEEQADEAESDAAAWEQEHQRHLFRWVAERVRVDFRDSTWQAFWQIAVEGKSARDVAESLGMSVGAVYIAKSRVLARVKEQMEEIRGEDF